MNKMRTLMLLQERQVLTPDQRVKLNKLHEQWEQGSQAAVDDNEEVAGQDPGNGETGNDTERIRSGLLDRGARRFRGLATSGARAAGLRGAAFAS